MVLPAPPPLPADASQIRYPERELRRRQGWLNWWLDHGQPVSDTYARMRRERERLETILLERRQYEQVLRGSRPPF